MKIGISVKLAEDVIECLEKSVEDRDKLIDELEKEVAELKSNKPSDEYIKNLEKSFENKLTEIQAQYEEKLSKMDRYKESMERQIEYNERLKVKNSELDTWAKDLQKEVAMLREENGKLSAHALSLNDKLKEYEILTKMAGEPKKTGRPKKQA